jgi:hypothetical protein
MDDDPIHIEVNFLVEISYHLYDFTAWSDSEKLTICFFQARMNFFLDMFVKFDNAHVFLCHFDYLFLFGIIITSYRVSAMAGVLRPLPSYLIGWGL